MESRTPLLDLDPDLGRLLPPERLDRARVDLFVRVTVVRRGTWDADRLAKTDPGHLGLVMVDGVIAREVLLADTTSIELLGSGDVLRPWHSDDESSLSRHQIRWTTLAEARLAVLDRQFASRLVDFPEINAVVIERVIDRAHRLALTQAISQLNGVDRRLLALLWHLADRWGRVTPEGIRIPLRLTHTLLADLVASRRPSVTTALTELEHQGLLSRDGHTIVLRGEPPSDFQATAAGSLTPPDLRIPG